MFPILAPGQLVICLSLLRSSNFLLFSWPHLDSLLPVLLLVSVVGIRLTVFHPIPSLHQPPPVSPSQVPLSPTSYSVSDQPTQLNSHEGPQKLWHNTYNSKFQRHLHIFILWSGWSPTSWSCSHFSRSLLIQTTYQVGTVISTLQLVGLRWCSGFLTLYYGQLSQDPQEDFCEYAGCVDLLCFEHNVLFCFLIYSLRFKIISAAAVKWIWKAEICEGSWCNRCSSHWNIWMNNECS